MPSRCQCVPADGCQGGRRRCHPIPTQQHFLSPPVAKRSWGPGREICTQTSRAQKRSSNKLTATVSCGCLWEVKMRLLVQRNCFETDSKISTRALLRYKCKEKQMISRVFKLSKVLVKVRKTILSSPCAVQEQIYLYIYIYFYTLTHI